MVAYNGGRRDVRTLKLVLAYDGTPYVGWQRQRDGVSIQGLLEAALSPLAGGRPVRVTAAGRTDAGVHALRQVASCQISSALTVEAVQRALNARLPPDVRVVDVSDAPAGFHARFWARAKTYAYHVLNAPVADPLVRNLVWHVPQRLQVEAISAALAIVRGTHDFAAFQAAGSRVSTTVRTVSEARLHVRPWAGVFFGSEGAAFHGPSVAGHAEHVGGSAAAELPGGPALLTFVLRADGFLRHMVRNLVGTAMQAGLEQRDAETLADVLAQRDRRRAGPTAPPQGLMLLSVEHGDGPVRSPTPA
jgi:tRNA pseudouridine38-40 synthase